MPKIYCLVVATFMSWCLQAMPVMVQAEEEKPVFELDCISFAGRFLGNAPVKKKAYSRLAVDGTIWAMAPDKKHAVITRVISNEAAEKAGLEPGSEIISVNGYPSEGLQLRQLFCAYHMYDPDTFTETLIVERNGSQKTLKLHLLTLDQCNAEERQAWLDIYKGLGY